MNIKEDNEKIRFVKWFSEIGKDSISLVGLKGANLGELYNKGISIPPGFIISVEAYEYFLEKAGIREKIDELLRRINLEEIGELKEITRQIKTFILDSDIPPKLEEEILESYELLDAKEENIESGAVLDILKSSAEPVFVAVRNSLFIENPEKSSFAGQQDSYLNIKGKKELIKNIKKCFASVFNSNSIYYRLKKGVTCENILTGVVVQKMINSDKSGVIFSRDFIDNSENLVIEAIWGLGEGISSARIIPDKYTLSDNLEIINKKISDKEISITRKASGEEATILLGPEKSKHQVLREHEIMKLSEIAKNLEEHYNSPQEIEFAISDGEVYILQTREIINANTDIEKVSVQGEIISRGYPVSQGIVSGKIKLVEEISDLEFLKPGEILLGKEYESSFIFCIERLGGVILDKGGRGSKISLILREFGIPCIIGTGDSTQKIQTDQIITMNGFDGNIYRGKVAGGIKGEIKKIEGNTKTKLKLIMNHPNFSGIAAKTGLRKIGLLKIEDMIIESGKHPLYFEKQGNILDYENMIYNGLEKFSEYFNEIWLRTLDIRSDEYNELEGCSEKEEKNPILGLHGIRFSLRHPKILRAELNALKRISEKNISVGVLIPQIINIEELKQTKDIIREVGAEGIKIGIIIETPAAIQLIKDFCDEGIHKVLFSIENLTQYMLAIDKDNENVFELYNEMHPSILYQTSYVMRVCQRYNIETGVFIDSLDKSELIKYFIEKSIASFIVTPDIAADFSEFVKNIEESIFKGTDKEPRLYEQKKENSIPEIYNNSEEDNNLEIHKNENLVDLEEEKELPNKDKENEVLDIY